MVRFRLRNVSLCRADALAAQFPHFGYRRLLYHCVFARVEKKAAKESEIKELRESFVLVQRRTPIRRSLCCVSINGLMESPKSAKVIRIEIWHSFTGKLLILTLEREDKFWQLCEKVKEGFDKQGPFISVQLRFRHTGHTIDRKVCAQITDLNGSSLNCSFGSSGNAGSMQ